MPDTTLSLVKSHASQQHTGRVTLLERKTALDVLSEIAAQARSGEGRLLLLEGEAGVGKSTLLEQFMHDLTATMPRPTRTSTTASGTARTTI